MTRPIFFSYLFKLTIIAIIKLCEPWLQPPRMSMQIWSHTHLRHSVELTFLPSNSCDPCAKTLSTLAGSEKVMNPNPLKRNDRKKQLEVDWEAYFEWIWSFWSTSLQINWNVFNFMTNFCKTISAFNCRSLSFVGTY